MVVKNCQSSLKNVNRAVIKVAMCENPPQIVKIGQKWVGRDFELLKLVIFAFNATLEIVETECRNNFDNIVKILTRGEAEFTFMGLLEGPDFRHLRSFNTHIWDGVVVLIPNKVSLVVSFLTIFDYQIWTILTFLLLILLILAKVYRNLRLNLTLTILTLFLTIFQSKMSSVLTKTTSQDAIKTLNDLQDTNLELVTIPRLYKIMSKTLTDVKILSKIKTVTKTQLYKTIQDHHQGDDNKAFIISYHVALEFVKLTQNGRPIYKMVDAFLVPSHRIFLFRESSVFLNEVRNIVLLLKQAGLMHRIYWSEKRLGNGPEPVHGARMEQHQLWVNFSSLNEGNLSAAVLPRLMAEMVDGVFGEEPFDLVLPSDDVWQTKIYYKLVEKQRLEDASEGEMWLQQEPITEPKLHDWLIQPKKKQTECSPPIRNTIEKRRRKEAGPGPITWTVSDISKAACILAQPPAPTTFDDEQEMRRVYTLIYDVFRHKNVLTQALNDIAFFHFYPELEIKLPHIWLLFYDLYHRGFKKRETSVAALAIKLFKEVGVWAVEAALWEWRTKLAAAVARLRIKHSALSLSDLLPTHLRGGAGGGGIVTCWINLKKVNRGGDLTMLEILTEAEENEEGRQRVFRILDEQRRTLRFAMSRPQIQFVLYETHSGIDAENDGMIQRTVKEVNKNAKLHHATLQGKLVVQIYPEQSLEINNNNEKSDENEQKTTESVKLSMDSDEKLFENIPVPETDIFDVPILPHLCPSDTSCINYEKEGCFLALLQRKQVIRLDNKYMIQMAENRGLFGRTSSSSTKTKGGKTARKKQEKEVKQPPKSKRRIKDLEVARIAAPTHTFLRHTKDCDIERCCRCQLDEDEMKEKPSIYRQWWSETTRHLIALRSNLVRNKILPPPRKNSKIDTKLVIDSFISNKSRKIDEIVAKSRGEDQTSVPIFPKLKLTRENRSEKVQMQLPVTMVKFGAL
nr:PREDICTED: uncharacterized protein LOC659893 isoform X2 [Tribolium castaneum]|eukprot:XP_015839699.1 PREDICTED: uncharacterized protein LOC659893 isoform X2 [Tribolium castaneum]